MKKFVVSFTVSAVDDSATWEDVEWAVRGLFSNFTIGAMHSLIAEEIPNDPEPDDDY
jgi:hypothetical protein